LRVFLAPAAAATATSAPAAAATSVTASSAAGAARAAVASPSPGMPGSREHVVEGTHFGTRKDRESEKSGSVGRAPVAAVVGILQRAPGLLRRIEIQLAPSTQASRPPDCENRKDADCGKQEKKSNRPVAGDSDEETRHTYHSPETTPGRCSTPRALSRNTAGSLSLWLRQATWPCLRTQRYGGIARNRGAAAEIGDREEIRAGKLR
jgi:hypothetical protein